MSVDPVQNGYYLTCPVLIHVCEQGLNILDNEEMLSWVLVLESTVEAALEW